MIINLQVKPLSANQMYMRGKRAKTKLYLDFQNEVRDELMGVEWPYGSSPLSFDIDAGLSARQADLDNVLKPLLDTLQTIFDDFNDNKVYEIKATKYIVPKGREFIRLRVSETEEPQERMEQKESSEELQQKT